MNLNLLGLPKGPSRQRGNAVSALTSAFKPGKVFQARVTGVFPENRAELMVAGQKVMVETDQQFAPGQTLTLEVVGSDDGLSFKLLPSEPLSSSSSSGPFPSDSITLSGTSVSQSELPGVIISQDQLQLLDGVKPGDVLQAKVTGIAVATKAELVVAGQTIVVDTESPLSTGQTLFFKVAGAEGDGNFRLVQLPSETSSLGVSGEAGGSQTGPLGGDAVSKASVPSQDLAFPSDTLRPGVAVPARVMAVLPDNQAALMVNGHRIVIKTDSPLTAGQTVTLAMNETGTSGVLELTPTSSGSSSFSFTMGAPPLFSTEALFGRTESEGPLFASGQMFVRKSSESEDALSFRLMPSLSGAMSETLPSAGDEKTVSALTLLSDQFKTADSSSSLTSRLKSLMPGQTLQVTVAGVRSENRAELSIQGQTFLAETDRPLSVGQLLLFNAVETEDGTSLRLTSPSSVSQVQNSGPANQPALADPAILSEEPRPLGRTLPLFQLFSKASEALSELGKTREPALKDILETLAIKSGTADVDFLPKLIRDSGLTLEKKLGVSMLGQVGKTGTDTMAQMAQKDLKGALLSLLADTPDGSESGVIRGGADALEGFQQINHHTAATHRFLLPFPIQTPEGFTFGQLMVNTGGRKKEEVGEAGRTVQVAFLMDMSALGSIRADFSILNKSITGRFILKDQETCDYISGLVPELLEQLRSVDFQVSNISCQVAMPKDLKPDALMLSSVEPDEDSGLNLVI